MNVQDVKDAIEKIRVDEHGNDEYQHIYEDELHQAVLKAIAEGAENAPELAREALKTNDIDFSRWYA